MMSRYGKHPKNRERKLRPLLPEEVLAQAFAQVVEERGRCSDFGINILSNVRKYLAGQPQHLSWTATYLRSYGS